MESKDKTSRPKEETQGCLHLLIALVCLTVASPVFLGRALLGKILMVLYTAAVLLGAVRAARSERRQFIIGLILGGLAILSGALGLADAYPHSAAVMAALMTVFFVYCTAMLFKYVLAGPAVTIDKLLAAVCVYLLIGLSWSMVSGEPLSVV